MFFRIGGRLCPSIAHEHEIKTTSSILRNEKLAPCFRDRPALELTPHHLNGDGYIEEACNVHKRKAFTQAQLRPQATKHENHQLHSTECSFFPLLSSSPSQRPRLLGQLLLMVLENQLSLVVRLTAAPLPSRRRFRALSILEVLTEVSMPVASMVSVKMPW